MWARCTWKFKEQMQYHTKQAGRTYVVAFKVNFKGTTDVNDFLLTLLIMPSLLQPRSQLGVSLSNTIV